MSIGRHTVWAIATFSAIAGLVASETVRAEPSSAPRYPHVVWHEDPAHRATIVWVTETPVESQTLSYGPHSHEEETLRAYRHRIESIQTVPEYGDEVYFHRAHLTDLHPSTTYYLRIESQGSTSEELRFETAPADDRPVTLLYGGDSRSSRDSRRRVNRQIAAYVESHDEVIGFVHGGDYVVSGMVWEQWKGWLEDWQLTRTEGNRLLPIVPGRGNHEFSFAKASGEIDNYNGLFGMPGGSERDYWTTRIGTQVAVITLDTTTSMGGRQRDWLKQQLETQHDSRRWIVVNYHRPAYPAVKSPGAARTHWVPLFEQYDVDLVCESDGHVLKRTVPIRDGERDPEGIVYVGEGGLGVPQRTPRSDRWYLQKPGVARSHHHFQVLRFGPDSLEYRAIGAEQGEVLDRASFEPAREGTPVPLELHTVRTPSRDRIEVVFNKGVTAKSRSTPSKYTLEPSIPIRSARRHDVRDRIAVLKLDEPLDSGVSYRLRVRDIEDHLGTTLEEARTSFQFTTSSSPDSNRAEPAARDSSPESRASQGPRTTSGCASHSPPKPSPLSLGGGFLMGGIAMRRLFRRRDT